MSVTVDTLVDEDDGVGTGSGTSLRDAIAAAAPGETIDFSVTGTIHLQASYGQLTIDKDLTISGPGARRLIISGNDGPDGSPATADGFRIFEVDDSAPGDVNVEISAVTITGGDPDGQGGAINSSENLTIRRSTITGNHSPTDGGAINAGGTLMIQNSTLSNNSAADGGAIRAVGGVTVESSTLSSNQATLLRGGAIRTVNDLTVRNSTITANSATADGGGIAGLFSDVTIQNSIVAANTDNGTAPDLLPGSGSLAVGFTLIGDNTGTGLNEAPVGAPDNNGNLIGGTNNGLIDPILGPLTDNGGPTQTHAALAGSPAIDAGDPNVAQHPDEFDTRGSPFVRVFDGDSDATATIDMGAYEAQALSPVVDTADDESDDNFSTGDLSLREAIELTSSNPGAETIVFDPSLSGDTIPLTLGHMTIAEEVIIDGTDPQSMVSIDAQQRSRIFNIGNPEATAFDVEISGLSLTGGQASDRGGAIRSFSNGKLTINEATIHNNSTSIGGSGVGGGGVFAAGDVWLTRSNVTDNTSDGWGGGIHSFTRVTLIDSTVSGNMAVGPGGGVYGGGEVTLRRSTVSGNNALGNGGGVFSWYGVTLEQSTVSGNTAETSQAGGIQAAGDALLIQSTVTENTAIGGVGGVYADRIDLQGSIVAANAAGNGMAPDLKPFDGGAVTGNDTLIGDADGVTITGSGNVVGDSTDGGAVHPLLGPLADNGGPTQTHALLPGSPALDAGDPNFLPPPDVDQRGAPFPRVANGRIDIGALEAQVLGDMDFDGDADFDDIDDFVQGLINPAAYEALYGAPPTANGDIDMDGDQDFDDIDDLVAVLTGGLQNQDPSARDDAFAALDDSASQSPTAATAVASTGRSGHRVMRLGPVLLRFPINTTQQHPTEDPTRRGLPSGPERVGSAPLDMPQRRLPERLVASDSTRSLSPPWFELHPPAGEPDQERIGSPHRNWALDTLGGDWWQ